MHRVGIIANPAHPVVRRLIPELVRLLSSQSGRPSLSGDLADLVSEEASRRICVIVDSDDHVVADADWVIAIGGTARCSRRRAWWALPAYPFSA